MTLCIFCGKGPTTKEHVWPQWMLDALGRNATINVWRDQDDAGTAWRARGEGGQVQVKCVCADCNSGWMSNLEGEAKILLGPLINDVSLRLDAAQQQLIAVWCTKTAMVWEFTGRARNWFYSTAEREHLRTDRSLPADTRIWIGRHQSSNIAFCSGRRLSGATPTDKPALSDGYVTTLAIARLAVQILTVRRAPNHHDEGRLSLRSHPGPWNNLLIGIWPPVAGIWWPPTLSFSEPNLEDVSRRFTNPP
jgi:hypothetical protein